MAHLDRTVTPRLRTAKWRRAWARDGFVKVQLLSDRELRRLHNMHGRLEITDSGRFTTSVVGRTEAENRRISAELLRATGPALARFAQGYEPVAGAFLTKGSGADGIPFHQDWNAVDERHSHCLSVWFPLVDVDARSGALAVLPGSHRWFTSFRSPTIDVVEIDPAALPAEACSTLVLRAGEAVIFDSRLFHSSHPNTSRRPRPAAQVRYIPIGEQLVMCRLSRRSDGYEMVAVSETAFYRGHELSADPSLLDKYTLDGPPVPLGKLNPLPADVIRRSRAAVTSRTTRIMARVTAPPAAARRAHPPDST